MNDRSTMLVVGASVPEGLEILEWLWNADLDVVAEVVAAATLRQSLLAFAPGVLIVDARADQDDALAKAILTSMHGDARGNEPEVLLVHAPGREPSIEIPATWRVVGPADLVDMVRVSYQREMRPNA